ncbi:MAG: hypothetical protein OXT70_01220 [Chloroflexota bacterium]|nr:hypothetical protein [Chloroflexota bacterium]
MKVKLIIALLVAGTLLAAGCGDGGRSGPVKQPATAAEYLDIACAHWAAIDNWGEDGGGDWTGWGGFASEVRDRVDYMKRVEPPEELSAWHEANLAMHTSIAGMVDGIPDSVDFGSHEVFEHVDISSLMVFGMMVSGAEQELPAETAALLESRDCG